MIGINHIRARVTAIASSFWGDFALVDVISKNCARSACYNAVFG